MSDWAANRHYQKDCSCKVVLFLKYGPFKATHTWLETLPSIPNSLQERQSAKDKGSLHASGSGFGCRLTSC
jgi:hypothetical protein